jgi:hypothetical protein
LPECCRAGPYSLSALTSLRSAACSSALPRSETYQGWRASHHLISLNLFAHSFFDTYLYGHITHISGLSHTPAHSHTHDTAARALLQSAPHLPDGGSAVDGKADEVVAMVDLEMSLEDGPLVWSHFPFQNLAVQTGATEVCSSTATSACNPQLNPSTGAPQITRFRQRLEALLAASWRLVFLLFTNPTGRGTTEGSTATTTAKRQSAAKNPSVHPLAPAQPQTPSPNRRPLSAVIILEIQSPHSPHPPLTNTRAAVSGQMCQWAGPT